jgi:hypothetical protein
MNRHHYALFVRNCRLILLLRRDFSEGDLNIFRPAEWRWKLPQVINMFVLLGNEENLFYTAMYSAGRKSSTHSVLACFR